MQHQGSASRCVLVVGGGIAGFAMMRALDQHGISAVLVDRLNGPPDAGLGLNLPGNAVRALRDLGVDGKLKERGVPVRRREYRNARNRLLFAVDEAGFWGAGAGSICALRGDVLELLRSCISESAVRWGTTVSAISQHGPEVEVSFRDADPESYDFVWPRTASTLAYGAPFLGTAGSGRPCCLMPVGGS
jgi:2-polyprenyl-6-methoxyphenol hydroxylase-like FAD-dependent oxidoreductase